LLIQFFFGLKFVGSDSRWIGPGSPWICLGWTL
jgi:hypothetical protein